MILIIFDLLQLLCSHRLICYCNFCMVPKSDFVTFNESAVRGFLTVPGFYHGIYMQTKYRPGKKQVLDT